MKILGSFIQEIEGVSDSEGLTAIHHSKGEMPSFVQLTIDHLFNGSRYGWVIVRIAGGYLLQITVKIGSVDIEFPPFDDEDPLELGNEPNSGPHQTQCDISLISRDVLERHIAGAVFIGQKDSPETKAYRAVLDQLIE